MSISNTVSPRLPSERSSHSAPLSRRQNLPQIKKTQEEITTLTDRLSKTGIPSFPLQKTTPKKTDQEIQRMCARLAQPKGYFLPCVLHTVLLKQPTPPQAPEPLTQNPTQESSCPFKRILRSNKPLEQRFKEIALLFRSLPKQENTYSKPPLTRPKDRSPPVVRFIAEETHFE